MIGVRSAARPVVIAGPTASGKSALALALAERDGGVVINADASQVYSCWQILTARPDARDLARAPHRLFGHIDPAVRHSAGDWLREAADAIAAARRDGLRPIIVGGTGLYLGALTEGLAPIPPVPASVRARSQAMLDSGDLAGMLAVLAADDPETHARIDRANPMRVQRAWDVLTATGRGLAAWHREAPPPVLADAVRIVVEPPTPALNITIARRFETMLSRGALEECRRFLALDVDPALPSARVIGAPPLLAHLRGEMDLGDAITASVTATRQYAKRQRTWLRNRMADWPRLPSPADPALVARR